MKTHQLLLGFWMVTAIFSVAEAAPKELVSSKVSHAKDTVLETPQDLELQKPLDLSVSFKAEEDTEPSMQLKTPESRNGASLFTSPDNKTKKRTVQLDGRILMTQEQEVEKFRTVDGAGIVINVQR